MITLFTLENLAEKLLELIGIQEDNRIQNKYINSNSVPKGQKLPGNITREMTHFMIDSSPNCV